MPSVSVSLNHVACTCACARANQRAFFAADDAATNRAGSATDERALCTTMVMPAMTTLREARADAKAEQQSQAQYHGYDASLENCSDHNSHPF